MLSVDGGGCVGVLAWWCWQLAKPCVSTYVKDVGVMLNRR